MRTRPDVPELRSILRDADHVDVKTATADGTLRQFAAGALDMRPAWLTGLFKVRDAAARVLRLDPAGRLDQRLTPENLPFTPGAKVHFFTVTEAVEDRYLLLETADRHLTAHLAIVAASDGDPTRFDLISVVRYHRRLGSLYFNLIRPFHLLVVGGMARAGARAA
ncbi:DUF2867 domain-containing protein [Thermomonospora umbrina]|uniref:Uncharacterized protein DUF2867 n=1 Tax=Thermomonospora umbrina TaxID=111806 RepID=A0A3D9SYM7_9ACTN|nr:DUF2867 domain-containing protein [Thermomonospora umbrina]REE99133.1 uncharacterized protein DUF2867 [Thermomonospora umbrina]